jgi:formylmethanofuran dehydrogenase subunit E
MKMYRTDDPIADFKRWDREQTKMLEKLPVCVHCGEPIHEKTVIVFDGECVCEYCLDEHYRKFTADLIEL